MSDLNEILADVKQEGDLDPFAALEKDTPSESPTENEPEEEEAPEVGAEESTPEEENIPFHKHPRWIEREDELKELRERDAQREEEFAQLRESIERSRDPESNDIPEHFVELYGDNPLAYQKWKEYEDQRKEEMKQEVIASIRREEEEAVQENQKWNDWVGQNLQTLSDSGKQFDKNELVKTMLEFKPTDSEGNLDFEAGYRIYEALHQKEDTSAKSQARKEIADIVSSARAKGESAKKDYLTPSDLRNKSWASL